MSLILITLASAETLQRWQRRADDIRWRRYKDDSPALRRSLKSRIEPAALDYWRIRDQRLNRSQTSLFLYQGDIQVYEHSYKGIYPFLSYFMAQKDKPGSSLGDAWEECKFENGQKTYTHKIKATVIGDNGNCEYPPGKSMAIITETLFVSSNVHVEYERKMEYPARKPNQPAAATTYAMKEDGGSRKALRLDRDKKTVDAVFSSFWRAKTDFHALTNSELVPEVNLISTRRRGAPMIRVLAPPKM